MALTYHRHVQEFDPSELFNAVDLTGVVTNALLGGAVARAHRFDIVGFVVLGICSGVGGGILRDLLLGMGFPVALTHPAYLPAAVLASTAAYLLDLRGRWTQHLLATADVLALGCWAATGTLKAYSVGLSWLPCLLMGVLTAIGGGIVRDVLVARPPVVFGGNPLYATVALCGSVEMLILASFNQPAAGMGLSILTCGAVGVAARWRGWVLPGAAQWNLRQVLVPPVSERYAAILSLPVWRRSRVRGADQSSPFHVEVRKDPPESPR